MESRTAAETVERSEAPRKIADVFDALLRSVKKASCEHAVANAAMDGAPARIHGALVALLLRAAAAAHLETAMRAFGAGPGPIHAARAERNRTTEAPGALIARGLAEQQAFFSAAGLDSVAFADPSPKDLDAPSAFAAWADEDAVRALLDAIFANGADGEPAPRDPGELYQELLAIRIRRLDVRSFRLKSSLIWLSSKDVLAEAAHTRAKWIARLAGLSKHAALRLADPLARAESERAVEDALHRELDRAPALPAGELVVESSFDRRRSGSHYTPDALCRLVLERTLAPLLSESAGGTALTEPRICDPAMGCGAFLVAAAEYLTEKIAGPVETGDAARRRAVMRGVVSRCLFGVDKDPVAVDLARFALARLAAGDDFRPPDLSKHLKCGDALVGDAAKARAAQRLFEPALPVPRFDWPLRFPDIFASSNPGFDACIGNPPWVAYAGRAAQPLDPALAEYYERENPAFFGYRTLHGLFVRRAAELVREGGRVGLVLPTSVADLDGYAPARAAHDALCDPDPALIDFGDGAFSGVFQPSMALTSTRRPGPERAAPGAEWTLHRSDVEASALRLLGRLDALAKIDGSLFGERGFQTTANDVSHLRRMPLAEAPFSVPIREGTDVSEFAAKAPRTFLNPIGLAGRFRAPEEWRSVGVLVRQTARYPIAALADGVAFRNSILAGFSNGEWSAPALAAYLNSNAVRFYHYTRHRDARQGMPQLKIGHLRALPALGDRTARARLDELGRSIGTRNTGILPHERTELDRVVCDALGFDAGERRVLERWSEAHPPPRPRSSKPAW